MSGLAGRVVWVTGASSGIGAALVPELARRGCRTAVSARRAEALEEVARGAPGTVVAPCDVTSADEVAAAAARAAEALGPVEVAILCAGHWEPVTPATFTPEVFRRHLDVNAMGTVNAVAALLPGMLARRSGRIVVVASVTGWVGMPLASAYGATKAFQISMADSLRADLAGSGVEVTVVAPGFVRTPMTAANAFPMPWMVEPSDAARTIADGLEAGRDEIAFPRQMSVAVGTLARLPGPLRRRWAARLARRRAA